MKTFPDYLYQKQTCVGYTDEWTPNFDAERFFSNQALCYIHDEASKPLPKILIWQDWRLAQDRVAFSEVDENRMRLLVEALLGAGFQIFSPSIQTVNKYEDLTGKVYKPMQPEALVELAIKQLCLEPHKLRLNPENIFVLEDVHIDSMAGRRLIEGRELPKDLFGQSSITLPIEHDDSMRTYSAFSRVIYLRFFVANIDKENLIAYFENSSHKVTDIVVDDCFYSVMRVYHLSLQESFPSAKVSREIKRFSISDAEKAIKSATREEDLLVKLALEDGEIEEALVNLNFTNIVEFLKQTPKLKRLVYEANKPSYQQTIFTGTLPYLRELELERSQIPPEVALSFVRSCAETLEILKLPSTMDYAGFFSKLPELPKLQEISLVNEPPEIIHRLSVCKKIFIHHYNARIELYNLDSSKTEYNFYNCTIIRIVPLSVEVIIPKISFTECIIGKSVLGDLESRVFFQYFELKKTTIIESDLFRICAMSEYIKVDDSQISGDHAREAIRDFPRLRHLNASSIVLSKTAAQYIIRSSYLETFRSEKIEHVDLRAGGLLANVNSKNLSNLIVFNIATNFNLKDCEILLKNAKKLKDSFLFCYCRNEGNLCNLEPNSLLELQNLIIYSVTFNLREEELIALVKAAPNLKKLQLVQTDPVNGFARWLSKEKPKLEFLYEDIHQPHKPIKKIDADTKHNKEKTLIRERRFFTINTSSEPNEHLLREKSYNTLTLTPGPCSLEKAFELSNSPSAGKINISAIHPIERIREQPLYDFACDTLKSAKHPHYYAQLYLQENTPDQEIPSLNLGGEEDLVYYAISPEDAEVELKYDIGGFYSISVRSNKPVNLEYIVKISPSAKLAIPANVQKEVSRLKQFKAVELKYSKPLSGAEYLSAINKGSGAGACRHRAISGMAALGKSVVFGVNSVHAFLVLQVEPGRWEGARFIKPKLVALDLEGYATNLTPLESARPKRCEKVLAPQVLAAPAPAPTPTPAPAPSRAQVAERAASSDLQKDELQTFIVTATTPTRAASNKLLKVKSASAALGFIASLVEYCHENRRKIFILDAGSKLKCYGKFIRKEEVGDTLIGRLTKEDAPSGDFYDFLSQNQSATAPILLVDYSQFSSNREVVATLKLLEDRVVEGVKVPESYLILGLINLSNVTLHFSSSFYKFFPEVLFQPSLEPRLQKKSELKRTPGKSDYCIDFYQRIDWKPMLIGSWIPSGEDLVFKLGILHELLQYKHITIKNGPWHLDEFKLFWLDVQHREKICIDTQEGYDWDSLSPYLSVDGGLSEDFVLNPATVMRCFAGFETDKVTGYFIPSLGFIADYQEKTFSVLITHPLSDDLYARLLSACKAHQVQLKAKLAPGVRLPKALEKAIPPDLPTLPAWDKRLPTATQVIHSDDVDASIAMLQQLSPPRLCIVDVSEQRGADLWIKTAMQYEEVEGKLQLRCSRTDKLLLKALKNNETIILRGDIPTSLIYALDSVLRDKTCFGGLLIIVSRDISNLSFVASIVSHKVSSEEKSTLLGGMLPSGFDIEKTPFATLRVVRDISNSFNGLDKLELPKFGKEDCALENAAIRTTKHFDAINCGIWDILDKSPYVLMMGLTGAGKSYFMQHEFKHPLGIECAVYTLDQEERFIANKTPNLKKVLVVDEFNKLSRKFSELWGILYNDGRTWKAGESFSLTKDHHIVFIGNPTNYGGNRELAEIFRLNGRVFVFPNMPPFAVYERDLKWAFFEEKTAPTIVKALLEFYSTMCNEAKSEIAITPRQLITMAGLITRYHRANPEIALERVCQFYIEIIGTKLASCTLPPIPIPAIPAEQRFVSIPSRLPYLQRLQEIFDLRALQARGTNATESYGGLLGIILKGPMSSGKSHMIAAMLSANGFVEKQRGDQIAADEKNTYYRLDPASSDQAQQAIAHQAFMNGSLLVMEPFDAFNLEYYLNAYSTGLDENGQPPEKPGFKVIGALPDTPTYGTYTISPAVEARFLIQTITAYTSEEGDVIRGEASLERLSQIPVPTPQPAYPAPAPMLQEDMPASLFVRILTHASIPYIALFLISAGIICAAIMGGLSLNILIIGIGVASVGLGLGSMHCFFKAAEPRDFSLAQDGLVCT